VTEQTGTGRANRQPRDLGKRARSLTPLIRELDYPSQIQTGTGEDGNWPHPVSVCEGNWASQFDEIAVEDLSWQDVLGEGRRL
jgi:hypothetical protein